MLGSFTTKRLLYCCQIILLYCPPVYGTERALKSAVKAYMTCNLSLSEQAGCTHDDDALASGRMTNLKARAIRCKSEQEVAT